jgi:CheY-like chemotaxis protein
MSKTILLAEDDEDNRDLVEFVIARSGLDVTMYTAENGQIAVQMAQSYRPVLILMDMQMPVMDGYTAVSIIKADPALTNIPIIAFTALARPEDKIRTREVGCIEHYTKPMDPEELLSLIRKYIGE